MTAQEYLEKNWSDKNITAISILSLLEDKKLTGELIIQDYPNLQEIDLPNQELTSLIISNCPKLEKINVWNNQLVKLEVDRTKIDSENKPAANEIKELIAGGNELSSLNLANCSQISKLMIPDNSFLTEIENLNLVTIKDINITNTLINLTKDYEELQAENKRLYEALRRWDEAGLERKLVQTEAIQTSKQADEAAQRLLKRTEKEWRDFFGGGENELLELRLATPAKKRVAKQILEWIIKVQVNGDYQKLVDQWNEVINRGDIKDFDCTLDSLTQLLRVRNYISK
jgi:hypothetical protein